MVLATAKHSTIRGLEDVLEGFTNSGGNRLVLDQVVRAFSTTGSDYGYDYAVCHPCSPAYLPAAKDSPLAAARKRAESKRHKYERACRSHDIEFRATVLEVFGAWSPDMEELGKKCSDSLRPGQVARRDNFNLDCRQLLSLSSAEDRHCSPEDERQDHSPQSLQGLLLPRYYH